MHSVRRAAARAVSSSSMAVAVPRQQVASFAMRIGRANVRQPATMRLPRYFSQTSRFAQEEKDAAVEEAVESTEQTGSTVDQSTADQSTADQFTVDQSADQSTADQSAVDQSTSDDASPLQSSPTERERQKLGFTIFISNMTFDATEVHLREAFSKYGEVTSINIGRDGRGLSRGFGFVTFETQEAAKRAVDEAHKSFWHGRRINVDFRRDPNSPNVNKRGPSGPTTSIYVGNIPYETSDADLNRLFRELEGVTDVRVAVDRNTGWPRGFAHADFRDVESAQRAYDKVSNTTMGGRRLRVDFSEDKRQYRRPMGDS
ncbi:RNA-binding domain-containing protein [Xylariaceae sp. FL0662B]|nr:RNA-binding domain-containing protein [Xylariaceae sp. FL0662B]